MENSQLKVRKVQHTHMKQIILPQLFLSLHDWTLMALWKKLAQPPSPKHDISSPQYTRSPRNLKFSQFLATRYKKKFQPHKKKYLWVGEIYHGKQRYKDRLPESCQGSGPKVRNGRNYEHNHFFCLRLYSLLSIQGIFKSHLEKINPPKVPIPTQNPNFS